MKAHIHYSLGIGGFDGYRTVTLPKYLENSSRKELMTWLQNWIDTHIKGFHYNLDDWILEE